MADLNTLRESLSNSVERMSTEPKKEVAIDVLVKIIDALESGVGTFGNWEQSHLTLALAALLAGKYDEARGLARQAIWPEENRHVSAVARSLRRQGLLNLHELKRGVEAAQAVRSPHSCRSNLV